MSMLRSAALLSMTSCATMKCNHGCSFCNSSATPNGPHSNIDGLLTFFAELLEATRQGHIKVASFTATGDGEPAKAPLLRKILRGAATFTREVRVATSGVDNEQEGARLMDAAPYLYGLQLTYNPEDSASLERMKRTLSLSFPINMFLALVCRVYPDRDDRFREEVGDQLVSDLSELGYCLVSIVKPRSLLDRSILHARGAIFVRNDGAKLQVEQGRVAPEGRALPRLNSHTVVIGENFKCPMLKFDGGLSDFLLQGGEINEEKPRIRVHTMNSGALTYCCNAWAKPLEEMNINGLYRLIAGWDLAREQLRDCFRANVGRKVHSPCEICPLYK